MTSITNQQLSGDNVRSLIVSWIRGDVGDDNPTAVKTHHPQTCEWIFQHEQFKTWIKSTNSTCLLFSGPPGAGKTVSASAVTKYLEDRGLRTTTFYFSFSEPSKRTSITALRALALELLALHDSVPDSVQSLYASDTGNGSSQLSDVVIAGNLLKELIKQISRVHIILDGLDECRDRKTLLPILGSLLESTTFGIVKWFLTSRPERDIRGEILRHSVLDIEASVDSIKSDINRFLHESRTNDQWNHKIDDIVEKSGGNFLWATMALRVLNDTSFTDEKHLARELDKFPRDLNGLYMRDLHRLSKRKSWQQELARKMFTFLVASFQPLRLSELSDALTVPTSPDSPPLPQGQPEDSLLEDLCSGLVVFDRSLPGSSEDPVLRFTHKSVHDFFLQILEAEEMDQLGIPIDASLNGLDGDHFEKRMRAIFKKFIESTGAPGKIERFFTSTSAANAELGQVCLQYLTNPRYNTPGFQKELLENRDHAFLKYAAVFWHAHLSMTRPKSKISHQVESFMESSAFWNCVTIQSIIAPHLYAIYHQGRTSMRYLEAIPVASAVSRPADIHYASPLPAWMRTPRVEDFDSFITQWCRVLNSCPGNLNQCYMDDKWKSKWPSTSIWFSNHVQCRAIYSNAMTINDLISAEIQKKKQRQITVKSTSASPADCGNIPMNDSVQVELYGHDCGDCRSSYCPMCLTTFPSKLATATEIDTDAETGISSSHRSPVSSSSDWEVVIYTSDMDTKLKSPSSEPRAVAVQWKSSSQETDGSIHDHQKGSMLVGSNLYSDSDSDSEDDEETLEAHPSIHSGACSTQQHCFLITRENANAVSYLWKSTYRNIVTRGGFHPTKPWVFWSPSAHVLCKADTVTGLIEQTVLPEPPGIDFATTQSLHKEMHVSENGSLLFYLILAVTPLGTGVQCRLCITALKTAQTKDATLEVSAVGSSSALTFFVNEALEPPLILVAWSPGHVYIALPPFSCKPKVVRLSLEPQNQTPAGISAGFETTQQPIFFPSTTPYRQPNLLVDRQGQLVLTLAAQLTSLSPQENVAITGSCEETTENQSLQGPVAISWSPQYLADWRDWNELTDANSEQYSSALDKARRLRGSYISPDHQFHVAVRSGLSYRTKMFISCS